MEQVLIEETRYKLDNTNADSLRIDDL